MSNTTRIKHDLEWNSVQVKLSFTEEYEEEYDQIGSWTAPYPKTAGDSYIFGQIESYRQADSYLTLMIYEYGTPDTWKTSLIEG